MTPSLAEIRQVKRAHEAGWMALDGVVGVGVGRLADGGNGIVVSVRSESEALRARIPETVDEVGIEVKVVGDVRAL